MPSFVQCLTQGKREHLVCRILESHFIKVKLPLYDVNFWIKKHALVITVVFCPKGRYCPLDAEAHSHTHTGRCRLMSHSGATSLSLTGTKHCASGVSRSRVQGRELFGNGLLGVSLGGYAQWGGGGGGGCGMGTPQQTNANINNVEK